MENTEIILYGNAASQNKAQLVLQEHYSISEPDPVHSTAERRLLFMSPVNEISLIPLLRQSGIQGFRLISKNQKPSRNASPFFL